MNKFVLILIPLYVLLSLGGIEISKYITVSTANDGAISLWGSFVSSSGNYWSAYLWTFALNLWFVGPAIAIYREVMEG